MPYVHRIYPPGRRLAHDRPRNDSAPIFFEDFDRLAFLARLRKVTERVGWRVVAWCLMETHYHLLLFAGREPHVSLGMQMLNGQYAIELNRRYDRRGHLFGERYRPTPIEADEHLVAAIAYTLGNPVRAGMVARLEDWAWSGTTRLEPRRTTQSRHTLVTFSSADTASLERWRRRRFSSRAPNAATRPDAGSASARAATRSAP